MENTEKRRHFFDLKIPLGSLLGLYGIVLLIYGIFGPKDIYDKSFHLDINVVWGALLIVISGAFLLSAYLGRRAKR